MKTYSTREAARKLGIHFITLHRYILAKKIPAPEVQTIGSVKLRLWSEQDIERVRKILPTIENGRKTRHKKNTTKTKKKSKR